MRDTNGNIDPTIVATLIYDNSVAGRIRQHRITEIAQIYNAMEIGKPITISEIADGKLQNEGYSIQKVTAIMRKLKNLNLVERKEMAISPFYIGKIKITHKAFFTRLV